MDYLEITRKRNNRTNINNKLFTAQYQYSVKYAMKVLICNLYYHTGGIYCSSHPAKSNVLIENYLK